jgi:hypothetical protein
MVTLSLFTVALSALTLGDMQAAAQFGHPNTPGMIAGGLALIVSVLAALRFVWWPGQTAAKSQ